MLVLTVILGILAAAFAALWLLSRKNLKNAVEELRRIRGGQTGRRLRLSSPDRLMERLIAEVNHLLDDQQKAEQASEKTKQESVQQAAKAQETKEFGFITVSAGEGLSEIFKGIGADYVIEGGQTMNPSTEDILNAADQVNARKLFIFPTNKNIILAAAQAARLEEKKTLYVVPSKTVPQGITALINFTPDLTAQENLDNMAEEMNRVRTGQITYAVRSTSIDGMEITEGDMIAIGDRGMLAVEKTIEEAALKALEAMIDEEAELVTLYYGEEVAETDAQALLEEAQAQFPQVEIELQNGGQPVYYYLISAE